MLSSACGRMQADMMELQGGLVGWLIERLVQTGSGLGPFFRLKLEIPGSHPVSGVLELTQPGKAISSSACHRSVRKAMSEVCKRGLMR